MEHNVNSETLLSPENFVTRQEYINYRKKANNSLELIQKETEENTKKIDTAINEFSKISMAMSNIIDKVDTLSDTMTDKIDTLSDNVNIRLGLIDNKYNEKFKRIDDGLNYKFDKLEHDITGDLDSIKTQKENKNKLMLTIVTTIGAILVAIISII